MPTAFQNSVAEDYRLAGDDRGQSVTYTPADGSAPFVAANSSYTELTVEEELAAGGLFVAGDDRRWWLGGDQFPAGRQPVQGDSLTDAAGVVWVVALEAVQDPLLIGWVVHTRRAR